VHALVFLPGYGSATVDDGRAPVLLLLLAFLVAFALARLYTRVARVRGWGSGSAGGIHLHHMVFGIVIVLLAGLLVIAIDPGGPAREILAIAFGIGAALTLDEFALWLYLRDVYWCPEGRSSIDAALMGVLLAALLLVGTSPFGIGGRGGEARAVAFAMIAFNVVTAVTTFLKGKLAVGMAAVFLPVVGVVGAVRLAKPRSLWAKWFYGDRPQKLMRASARYDEWSRFQMLRVRVDDVLGGAPFSMSTFRAEMTGGWLVMPQAMAGGDRTGPGYGSGSAVRRPGMRRESATAATSAPP
jgi:hypothetical protein